MSSPATSGARTSSASASTRRWSDQRLAGKRIGVIGLGGLPGGITSNIETALEPTGGRLVAVGVVGEPPDLRSLGGDLASTRFADLASQPGHAAGVRQGHRPPDGPGGTLLDRVRGELFSRASGAFSGLDDVIVVRDQPEDLGPVERSNAGRLESGILDGVGATGAEAVGVEATDADPSSIGFFKGANVSSVDDIDQVAGRVATILALLGAKGTFRRQGLRRPAAAGAADARPGRAAAGADCAERRAGSPAGRGIQGPLRG